MGPKPRLRHRKGRLRKPILGALRASEERSGPGFGVKPSVFSAARDNHFGRELLHDLVLLIAREDSHDGHTAIRPRP